METTIIGYMLGLYKDNGKESGNYYDGLYIRVLVGEWKRKWKLLFRLYDPLVEKAPLTIRFCFTAALVC